MGKANHPHLLEKAKTWKITSNKPKKKHLSTPHIFHLPLHQHDVFTGPRTTTAWLPFFAFAGRTWRLCSNQSEITPQKKNLFLQKESTKPHTSFQRSLTSIILSPASQPLLFPPFSTHSILGAGRFGRQEALRQEDQKGKTNRPLQRNHPSAEPPSCREAEKGLFFRDAAVE